MFLRSQGRTLHNALGSRLRRTATSLPFARERRLHPLRPPVVTIMGHVDHGKTTLLDQLRKSAVAAGEAGGITQHIGAFSVELPGSRPGDPARRITFLDTPGHAAFSRIRERGAQVTDIVVLVVAADDGVMAQTVESVRFAEAAKVPLVVAINKCDRVGMERASRIKEELLKHGVICEDLGGETQTVAVSGLTGLNLDRLLECIHLQGEMLELRADPAGPVSGTIIESKMKTGLGECATLLVQGGTLRPGTLLVAEDAICKVRAMADHAGRSIAAATPSTPVEVAGWRRLPPVGASVIQVHSEEEAAQIAAHHLAAKDELDRRNKEQILKEREEIHDKMWQIKQMALSRHSTTPLRHVLCYEEFHPASASPPLPTLHLLIKGDVVGSLEAVASVIAEIPSSKARVNVVSSAVGPVTETDIRHAKAIKGIAMDLPGVSHQPAPSRTRHLWTKDAQVDGSSGRA